MDEYLNVDKEFIKLIFSYNNVKYAVVTKNKEDFEDNEYIIMKVKEKDEVNELEIIEDSKEYDEIDRFFNELGEEFDLIGEENE